MNHIYVLVEDTLKMIENWFQLLHVDLFLRVRCSLHVLQALKSLVSQT